MSKPCTCVAADTTSQRSERTSEQRRDSDTGCVLIGRGQSEVERRSRSGRRFDPHSTTMRLDRFLAECESNSVPGVFLSVQPLEDLEYAALECRLDTGTVVLHGERPIEIHPFG